LDIAGINSQIDTLLSEVENLPLTYEQRISKNKMGAIKPPENETTWQKLVREIWHEAKQLVRIQNTNKSEIPLLPPDQEFFLRENLKLRLMSVHLTLLTRDEAIFRHEIADMQNWVDRYFDVHSAKGVQMMAGLKKLAESSINIDLPDISQSLQAVRSYRLARENETRVVR
jgi:uroporphyrin-3 C-methyltransferase